MNKLVVKQGGNSGKLPKDLILTARAADFLWVEEKFEEALRFRIEIFDGITDDIDYITGVLVCNTIDSFTRHSKDLIALIEAHPNDVFKVIEVDSDGYRIFENDDGTETVILELIKFDKE
jgi:hypothetical protein